MKILHVRNRVMTSHDACISGTSRVFTIASLQRLKIKALIPAPADCEVRSVLKFLNAQSTALIEINRQLCQQSFPAPCCRTVTEHLFRNLCARCVPKQLTPEHKATRIESAFTIVVHSFLHLKKFLSRQHFQNDRETEMYITQWF